MNSAQLGNVDLNLLVLFDVVLAERHVGRSARRLNLTASAVSHGLARLRRLFADPLFLRTPKGVVPTARASELAPAIAEILARVQVVVAAGTPFVPSTSTRRFVLGISDATAAVQLPALLAHTRRHAPLIDLSLRQLLPAEALSWLEARQIDLAIAAVGDVPARFVATSLEDECFVIAARKGHPFLSKPTLSRYCAAQHVLVSSSGDPYGFVDEALRRRHLSRRVALTVPSFLLALAALEQSDLLAAIPLGLARAQAARFGAAWVESPVPLPSYTMQAVVTRAALQDAGVAWLHEALTLVAPARPAARRRPAPARAGRGAGAPRAR